MSYAVGSYNPQLTFPTNNRLVGNSPQTNATNINGNGNLVNNNNSIDQSKQVINLHFHEGDTIVNNRQAPKKECKAGKGKGKGKGKAKKARHGKLGGPNKAKAASPMQMMMKMMTMMMSLMQSQAAGGVGGGMPPTGMARNMGSFAHPGFMV